MIQTIDFHFELLFLVWIVVFLIGMSIAMVMAIRRKRSGTKRLIVGLEIGWIVYLAIVFLVAAATPQQIIPLHQELCRDEMCFAIVDIHAVPELGGGIESVRANGNFYIVTVRVSSRARGRAQSERGIHAVLWSPQGKIGISPAGQNAWNVAHPQNVALTARVLPGQVLLSVQVFDMPEETRNLGLTLMSEGFSPGYLVIGECPLFHKPTVLRLDREEKSL